MENTNKGEQLPQRPRIRPVDVMLALVPVAFVIGLRTFAGPCVHEDGSIGGCAMASHELLAVGVLGIALALVRLLVTNQRARRVLDLLLAASGVALVLIPGVIAPLCMMTTMRCHTIMAPFARIMGGLLAVGAVACGLTVDRAAPTGGRRRG